MSQAWSKEDSAFMNLALDEAKKAQRICQPNPAVGAVLVKDGLVIGQGHTQRVGQAHAEIMAFRSAFDAGHDVTGATLYVTLEPCAHYGRTPPCVLAIIQNKIARVVVAACDVNPLVQGKGLEALRAQGIQVEVGLCEKEAAYLMRGFFKYMTTGRPYVRVKWASTLDGFIALPNRLSQWITGAAAREDTHVYRARAGAVVTGIGTVQADDCLMNVRLPEQPVQPYRVIVDPRLEIDTQARILHSEGGQVIIATSVSEQDPQALAKIKTLEKLNALIWYFDPILGKDHFELSQCLLKLAQLNVCEVHVEAGPRLTAQFLQADLVDELLVYQAPILFGQGFSPATLQPPLQPGLAQRFQFESVTMVGQDVRMIARR